MPVSQSVARYRAHGLNWQLQRGRIQAGAGEIVNSGLELLRVSKARPTIHRAHDNQCPIV
jgi:hypothetical protein